VINSSILGLSGGAGDLNKIIEMYNTYGKQILVGQKQHTVIFMIDNDDGAKGTFKHLRKSTNCTCDERQPFIFVKENLYAVLTPLTQDGEPTTIEDFFEKSVKETKLNGKIFNNSEKGFNAKIEYGKNHFAKYVVLKNKAKINFSGFKPIIERIEMVLEDYDKRRQ